MERTDEQLLPAVYAFVSSSFNATPRQLGYLTQSRALVQALASPFGGLAGPTVFHAVLTLVHLFSVTCPSFSPLAVSQEHECHPRHWQSLQGPRIHAAKHPLVMPHEYNQSLTAALVCTLCMMKHSQEFLHGKALAVKASCLQWFGHAGYYLNRVWVVALGCTIWGCMTALFSSCTSLNQGYLLWAVNGIGLSLVIPTGQSLTADYYSEAARGRAFGALYLTGAIGAMLGSIYATNLGAFPLISLRLSGKKGTSLGMVSSFVNIFSAMLP